MSIYTFHFSKSFSKTLGITFEEKPEFSDQFLSDVNYLTTTTPYGGGASGSKNGHYGCRHSDETRQLLREKALGRPAPNKGVPNPAQSERFRCNNPMKNDLSREKMRQSKIGKEPSNKIRTTIDFSCKWCGKTHTRLAKKKAQRSFCGKSCAASYSNTYRYSSQPPAAEQANS